MTREKIISLEQFKQQRKKDEVTGIEDAVQTRLSKIKEFMETLDTDFMAVAKTDTERDFHLAAHSFLSAYLEYEKLKTYCLLLTFVVFPNRYRAGYDFKKQGLTPRRDYFSLTFHDVTIPHEVSILTEPLSDHLTQTWIDMLAQYPASGVMVSILSVVSILEHANWTCSSLEKRESDWNVIFVRQGSCIEMWIDFEAIRINADTLTLLNGG